MTDAEKKEAIERLEQRYSEEYGKKTTVDGSPAMEGVLYGYALNIQKCIGCRRCVYACVKENNQSRNNPEIQWIRVLKMEKGNFTQENMDKGTPKTTASRSAATPTRTQASPLRASTTTSPRRSPKRGTLLPDAVHAAQTAVRQGLPGKDDLQVRRHRRHRLQLVHRVQDVVSACPYWARRFNWAIPTSRPRR
jgi:molybdopterin-containing oxidoreductase family iron-sulfur binding subunit